MGLIIWIWFEILSLLLRDGYGGKIQDALIMIAGLLPSDSGECYTFSAMRWLAQGGSQTLSYFLRSH